MHVDQLKSPKSVLDVVRFDSSYAILAKKKIPECRLGLPDANVFSEAQTADDLRARIKELEKRIKRVKKDTAKEKIELKTQHRQDKRKARHDMRQRMEELAHAKDKPTERNLKKIESEIKKLRGTNSQLRQSQVFSHREIEMLKVTNRAIEEANRKAQLVHKDLLEYTERQKEIRTKLQQKCATATKLSCKLRKANKDGKLHLATESNSCSTYRQTIEKIVNVIQNRSRDVDFIDAVFELAVKGLGEAEALRNHILAKHVINVAKPIPPPPQQLSIKLKARKYASGSDSESESDDETSISTLSNDL